MKTALKGLVILSLASCFWSGKSWQKKETPAVFVFGDSSVDVGNNNYIATTARANFYPHGIDFGGPTGRFSNARTTVDIVGELLGANDRVPPYLAPTTSGLLILQGVNYASAGAGILNDTGEALGGRINFDAQIDLFAKTKQDIIQLIGASAAEQLIGTAIFALSIGSNDVSGNYLSKLRNPQFSISAEGFCDFLIARLRVQLTRMYKLGARKVVMVNLGFLGCSPDQRDRNPSSGSRCVAFPNRLARIFNARLKPLIQDLRTTLEGSNYVYGDIYNITDDILRNYKKYGLENIDSACCHLSGRFGGDVPCNPFSSYCPDRSKYFFWDSYHTTDAVNVIVARRLVYGDASDIWPFNVRKLLDS